MSTERAPTEPPERGERLQKVLARAGFGSRRACEELIASGRVRVNGRPAVLGARVVPGQDRVEVDGEPIPLTSELVYLVLHKPPGVVTTARDPQGRPTVLELVPRRERLFPVGRLDRDTQGLLLLTNDGDFALRMTHPRYGVPKTYVAEVAATASPRHLARLRRGLQLEDGPARAESARVLGRRDGRSLVEVVVREGRKRLVRRLLAAAGLPVVSLTRTAIGPLRLGRLRAGEWRELRPAEVLELRRAASGGAPASPQAQQPSTPPSARGGPGRRRGRRGRRVD